MKKLLCSYVSFLSIFAAVSSYAIEPSRVLIVYNSNWTGDGDNDGMQDSLQVAKYYAEKRGIPESNIFGVACSTGLSDSYGYGRWSDFYNEMIIPIRNKINYTGETSIDVILLCYGVPIGAPQKTDASPAAPGSVDNDLMLINFWTETSGTHFSSNPYFEPSPGFNSDKGHFDHSLYQFAGKHIYLTSRIDGKISQAPWSSKSLVDQALYGELYINEASGYYKGNVYIDARFGEHPSSVNARSDSYLASDIDVVNGSYGSYAKADKNIAYGEHWFLDSGFPLKWEDTYKEIGDIDAVFMDGTNAAAAPQTLFYGGWYNFTKYNDVWEWLPGSVACDLNSNSCTADGVRNGSGEYPSFGAAALERGATCVSGVIGEPQLYGHQRPNVLMHYIMEGYCFAEAAALSNPVAGGWLPINIGDPLYAPLKVKTPVLDTQQPRLADGFPVVSYDAAAGNHKMIVAVDNSLEPEVARIEIEYGLTADYGLTATSGQGYWSGKVIALGGILKDSTFHYRVRLTDPVGNTSLSEDFIFSSGAAQPDSDKTVNPANGHAYQRFGTPRTWSEAKAACEAKGGYLATVTSQAEQDYVISKGMDAWIGATDEAAEGTWQWITGEPWSWTDWREGEPNDLNGGEDYLQLWSNGKWNDNGGPGSSNDVAMPYICEWNGPIKTVNPANGHAYQRFNSPMTWQDAKAACAALDGYLATITSKAENDWILAKMADNAGAWLGATDEVQEGAWRWITGETWNYANWSADEPNDGCDGQDYLQLYADGTWDDHGGPGCFKDITLPYICEWNGRSSAPWLPAMYKLLLDGK